MAFHLAGVNRPYDPEEFRTGNADFTAEICRVLQAAGRRARIVLTSSIQAELDNPYGRSKRAAEKAVRHYVETAGASATVHRLANLFGKWSRPNYNSVVATFCHNIAHGLPIQISDPANRLDLTYIDDVIAAFLDELAPDRPTGYHVAPGDAADLVLGAGAGVACEPESPEGICDAVARLCAMPAADLEAMGARGRAYYQKELALAVGTTRFETLFRHVVEQGC